MNTDDEMTETAAETAERAATEVGAYLAYLRFAGRHEQDIANLVKYAVRVGTDYWDDPEISSDADRIEAETLAKAASIASGLKGLTIRNAAKHHAAVRTTV